MPGTRVLRLDAQEWNEVVAQARQGGGDSAVSAALAEHLGAPVKATMISTAGSRGTTTRLTMVGDRVLLVTQRMAEGDGGATLREPGAELIFVMVDDLWPAIARTLPPVDALRAPASAAGGTHEDRTLDLTEDEAKALLAREDANLQVSVEAWRGGEAPAVVWARLWSVVDDRLLDVRTHDGALRLTERTHGAVARELRWALVGAIDATTPEAGGGTGDDDGTGGSGEGATR